MISSRTADTSRSRAPVPEAAAILATARKARWRDRQRRGVVVAQVEVSAVGLDFLIATHWLAESDATDPVAIGRAISALIEASGQQI
jgi:hypothetical protein